MPSVTGGIRALLVCPSSGEASGDVHGMVTTANKSVDVVQFHRNEHEFPCDESLWGRVGTRDAHAADARARPPAATTARPSSRSSAPASARGGRAAAIRSGARASRARRGVLGLRETIPIPAHSRAWGCRYHW